MSTFAQLPSPRHVSSVQALPSLQSASIAQSTVISAAIPLIGVMGCPLGLRINVTSESLRKPIV